MKATETTREGAKFIEMTHSATLGVTYKCLKCGHTKEANAYYEADHKEMIHHAAHCGVRTTKEEPSMSNKSALQLQQYGANNALHEMAGRVRDCVPGGKRLKDTEALSLAQVAFSTGLDPFTGEIWYIPGKGPMAGIKGLRRRAREQSTYSVTLRAMRNDELGDHNVKPGDVGRMCELFRHDVLQRAVEINKAAGDAVIPVKPILGVGIWRRGDQIASSKSSTWMADKRAEADALRKGFDLTELAYSDEVNGSQLEFMETAGGWSVAPEEDEAIRREVIHNAERRAEADKVPMAMTSSLDDTVAKYKDGKLELSPWVEEIREAVEAHPQASDPLTVGNGSFVKQLEISAGRKVTAEQFRAFVKIVFMHDLNEITFGEASVLMNTINTDDFEAKVIGLLS